MSTTGIPEDAPDAAPGASEDTFYPRSALGGLARETWELELLISGAVIFGLVQLPGPVSDAFERLDPQFAGGAGMALFFTFYYVKLTLYSLITAFVVHLVLRSYWAALVGLEAVFPDGVDWENVQAGPLTLSLLRRKQPDLPSMVRRTDRAANVVFSVAFAVVMIFLVSLMLSGLFGLVAWGLHVLWPEAEQIRIFFVLAGLFLLPVTLIPLLDKKLGRRLTPGSRLHRWGGRLTTAAFYLGGGFLHSPITLTLTSHARRRKRVYAVVMTVFAVSLAALIGFFLVYDVLLPRGALEAGAFPYLPDDGGRYEVAPVHYESLRPEGPLPDGRPLIPSDLIRDPVLRVFLPLLPDSTRRAMDELCPELAPLSEAGLRVRERQPPVIPEADLRARLGCFGELYEIELDDRPVAEPGLRFTTHAATGTRGLVAYLSLADRAAGEHLLTVRRVALPGSPKERDHEPRAHEVPFWYVPR